MHSNLTNLGLRRMVRGSICLGFGLFLLTSVSAGWFGAPNGLLARVLLVAAMIANLAGSYFFLRYLIGFVKDMLRNR